MKKTISLILALTVIITSFASFTISAQASSEKTYKSGGFKYYYSVKDNKVNINRILQTNRSKKTLNIPAKISGKKVVTFNIDNMMYDENFCNFVTKVKIPSTVTKINGYNFQHNNINLKSIVVDSKNKNYKTVKGVLYSKDMKTLVKIPHAKKMKEYKVPKSVTFIDTESMSYLSAVKKITINAPAKIDSMAVVGCTGLKTIFVGKKVKSIAYDSFGGYFTNSDLKTISVDKKNKKYASVDGVLYNKKKTTLIKCPAAKSYKNLKIAKTTKKITKQAFVGCYKLKGVTLPSGLTEIGADAFSSCSSLKSINIPKKVKKVKQYTFLYCQKLTSVKLPSSLKEIGYAAFEGCSSLKSITIPKSVKKLGGCAFQDCTKLEKLTIKNKNLEIKKSAIPYIVTGFDDETWQDIIEYKVTIIAPKGSKAQAFAKKYGIKFKAL